MLSLESIHHTIQGINLFTFFKILPPCKGVTVSVLCNLVNYKLGKCHRCKCNLYVV